MITADQHRIIGHLMGYPECCIEEWVNDPDPLQGVKRGAVKLGWRTPKEIERLNAEISELLGFQWDCAGNIVFVPCSSHSTRVLLDTCDDV